MKTKTHQNYIRNAKDEKVIYIGLVNCKACKKRCRSCHWPFSVSTATDEKNFCSSFCEDKYFGNLQK